MPPKKDLRTKNIAIFKKLTFNKKQLKKIEIHQFLESILDVDLSRKVLVDITLGEELIVLGRPAVFGSSKKQMRHITPYTFVKLLIKTRVESLNQDKSFAAIKILFEDLKTDIKAFLPDDKGICLEKEDYNTLKEWFAEEPSLSKILETTKNKYFLIKLSDLPQSWDGEIKDSYYGDNFYKETENKYKEKKIKFLDKAFDLFQQAIKDESTYNITCEALARLIDLLLNKRKKLRGV